MIMYDVECFRRGFVKSCCALITGKGRFERLKRKINLVGLINGRLKVKVHGNVQSKGDIELGIINYVVSEKSIYGI